MRFNLEGILYSNKHGWLSKNAILLFYSTIFQLINFNREIYNLYDGINFSFLQFIAIFNNFTLYTNFSSNIICSYSLGFVLLILQYIFLIFHILDSI